jgi:hypothetical protein
MDPAALPTSDFGSRSRFGGMVNDRCRPVQMGVGFGARCMYSEENENDPQDKHKGERGKQVKQVKHGGAWVSAP